MTELDSSGAAAPEAIATDIDPVVDAPVVDVAPVIPVETKTPPKDMADSIRQRFRELNDIARAPDGKFVKKEVAPVAEEVAPEVEPVAEVAKVEPAKPEVKAPVVDAKYGKAPTSWKGGAQSKWDAVDPEIKAEVHRREEDFHKGIESYRNKAQIFDSLDAEIKPYEAMIRAANTTPQAVLRDFFNTAYVLKSGSAVDKAAMVHGIMQQYDVSIDEVNKMLTAAAEGKPTRPVEDPRVSQLAKEVEEWKATQKAQEENTQRAAYESVVSETQVFGSKPENKHFEAVKLDMAALLQSGRAVDLQDAYNKAVWANPEVRETLIAEQQAARSKQAADKAAAAKKAASANVVARGTLPSAPKSGGTTMDDTILATLRAINGRA